MVCPANMKACPNKCQDWGCWVIGHLWWLVIIVPVCVLVIFALCNYFDMTFTFSCWHSDFDLLFNLDLQTSLIWPLYIPDDLLTLNICITLTLSVNFFDMSFTLNWWHSDLGLHNCYLYCNYLSYDLYTYLMKFWPWTFV